jgi:membrane-anchored protein YejM (alkaline phosphatase superfamily)
MEHGRWGHNSEFVEQQVRVPLVLWVPGQAARELTGMTGHVDLTATVLPLLGVVSPAADYTLGRDLLGDSRRPFQALSDWSRIGFVDEEAKLGFALKSSGLFRQHATTRDDAPLELSAVLQAKQAELLELMRELGRFRDTGAFDLP